MAQSNVRYDAEMRKRAIDDRKGLATIDLINASKKPGKLGSRITMQFPANEEDYRAVADFMVSLMERRAARESPPETRPALRPALPTAAATASHAPSGDVQASQPRRRRQTG